METNDKIKRQTAQTLFTCLKFQLEVIEALLDSKALKGAAAIPIVAGIRGAFDGWRPFFTDGAEGILEPLQRIELRLGCAPKDR